MYEYDLKIDKSKKEAWFVFERNVRCSLSQFFLDLWATTVLLLLSWVLHALAQLFILDDSVKLILIHCIQIVMSLYNGVASVAFLKRSKIIFFWISVYTLLNLAVHSLFDHYIAEFVFAHFFNLILSCSNFLVSLAEVIVKFAAFRTLSSLDSLLFELPLIQMLITLQE